MLVQSRLLYAAATVLMAAASFTAYRDDDTFSAVVLAVVAVLLGVITCLPEAGLTAAGSSVLSDRASRVQRVLLLFAAVVLTVTAVIEAVQGDPRTAFMVASVLVATLASWRTKSSRRGRDPEVDGAAGPAAQ